MSYYTFSTLIEGAELNQQLYSGSDTNSNSDWDLRTSGSTASCWFGNLDAPTEFEKLNDDITADVAIVGAGISGMTTGYLLSKAGKKVAILDDGFIASGETGRTTAHITNALDDRYYSLEKLHGLSGAKLAAESHSAAINLIDTIIKSEGIDCAFERLDGYLFLDATDNSESLDKELLAVHNAGLSDVKLLEKSPLRHSNMGSCLCFPNQGQFQPLSYISALARVITSKYHSNIYTQTHADVIKFEGENGLIKTSDGFEITALNIVLATNAPIVDKVSKIYDKQQAYRTYVIAANIQKAAIPKALYWDTGNQKSKESIKPYHYVRTQEREKDDKYDLLIVGGEDHKTGTIKDEKEINNRFERLENWMRNRFPVKGPLVYRWSGQVMEPADGLAFIGRNPGPDKNVYIATGDSGNGITHGTLAGIILSDLILGKNNPWAELYSPDRKMKDKA
jgi:glycine/D-amino acid oxidase-like deaminating enzyme